MPAGPRRRAEDVDARLIEPMEKNAATRVPLEAACCTVREVRLLYRSIPRPKWRVCEIPTRVTLHQKGVRELKTLPAPLAAMVDGYARQRVPEGESGAAVYRLTRPGRRPLYLKSGTGLVAADITAEMGRLAWFAGRLPVPGIVAFQRTGNRAWLLTEGLPGQSAEALLAESPATAPQTVTALARFLRHLHALPVDECPWTVEHPYRLAQAKLNMESGRVDEADFDDERRGWSARKVWDEMAHLQPKRFGRTVTHGDFSLANVFLLAGEVTGCIDVGRAGIADPYQDLAILWSNLSEFGGDLQALFLREYGITRPDRRKIQWHLCLDEFC